MPSIHFKIIEPLQSFTNYSNSVFGIYEKNNAYLTSITIMFKYFFMMNSGPAITFLPIEKVQDPELDHNGQQNVPLFYSIRRKLSIGFVQFMN